jgi:hypothetical protein
MAKLRAPLLVAAVALLTVVPAAQAAPPSSAQRFADAALRARESAKKLGPALDRAHAAQDTARCRRVLESLEDVPTRSQERFLVVLVIAELQPYIQTVLPTLDRLVTDLTAIPTNDPILRSGRAAWRDGTAQLRGYPTLERPCEQFDRWVDSGFEPAAAPRVRVKDFMALLADQTDEERVDAKLKRGARRLRQLGISPGAAERFRGEHLFDGLESEESLLGESESEIRIARG